MNKILRAAFAPLFHGAERTQALSAIKPKPTHPTLIVRVALIQEGKRTVKAHVVRGMDVVEATHTVMERYPHSAGAVARPIGQTIDALECRAVVLDGIALYLGLSEFDLVPGQHYIEAEVLAMAERMAEATAMRSQ